MSDEMKGPREWWISPGVEAWQTDEVVMNPDCVKEYHIHVIEYAAFSLAQEQIKELVEALEFYAGNKGLRINFQTNNFESLDCEDAKDFHGAKARAALSKFRKKDGV